MARSQYLPGTLKLTTVVDEMGLPMTFSLLGGSKTTGPGPRKTIQRILRPGPRSSSSGIGLGIGLNASLAGLFAVLRLDCLGFGRPSSVADAVSVRVFGKVTVCGPLPVIVGGSLLQSTVLPLRFSEITPLLTSQVGSSQPLAFVVLPWLVRVHTSF